MTSTLQRWLGRIPDVSAVMARFPIATAIVAVFTLIIVFDDAFPDEEQMARLLAGLVISGYLCVSYTVAREGKGHKPNLLVQIGFTLVLAALAWFSEGLRLNLIMALAAVLLLLGNAVRWTRVRDDLHIWDYTHKIWTGAAFAALGSAIFLIGIFAIQAALKSLFGINIQKALEELIIPVGLGFLAPVYWLSTIPSVDDPYDELKTNPGFVSKAVAFLGTWLLSPLTLIYALILIAYAVKIIAAGELPKGEIAQLTTPFLIIGTLTWLVLYPPFIRDKLPAKLFRKSWFILSLPAAIMLAIAIVVRVREYGLTPERIALIFCVIWSLAIAVWFSLAKADKRDIRIIPGLAAVLFALGAILADRVSFMNQAFRLISNLKAAGIMDASGTVKSATDIEVTDEDAAQKAKGALYYVMRNNGDTFVKTNILPSEDLALLTTKTVSEKLGLNDVEVKTVRSNGWVNFHSSNDEFDITGFDHLYLVQGYGPKGKPKTIFKAEMFELKNDQRFIELFDGETLVTRFDKQDVVLSQPVFEGRIEMNVLRNKVYREGDKKIDIVFKNASYELSNPTDNFSSSYYVLTSGFKPMP